MSRLSLRDILGENFNYIVENGLECDEKENLFEYSLQRECIRKINIFVRFKSNIDSLPLPPLLKKWCKDYYAGDRRRHNRNICLKILETSSYRYLKSLLFSYSNIGFMDNSYNYIFAIHNGYKIREKIIDDNNPLNDLFNKYLPVRYVCEYCYNLHYREMILDRIPFQNVIFERFRYFEKFNLTHIFYIFHHHYFCHECFVELLEFSLRNNLKNGRVIQLTPTYMDQLLFINNNQTYVYPTL